MENRDIERLENLKREAYKEFFSIRNEQTKANDEKLDGAIDGVKAKIDAIDTELKKIKKDSTEKEDTELDPMTKKILSGEGKNMIDNQAKELIDSMGGMLSQALVEKKEHAIKTLLDRITFLEEMKSVVESKDEVLINEFSEKYKVSEEEMKDMIARGTKIIDEQIESYNKIAKESRYMGITALSEIMDKLVNDDSFFQVVVSSDKKTLNRYTNDINSSITKSLKNMKNRYSFMAGNFKASDIMVGKIINDIKKYEFKKEKDLSLLAVEALIETTEMIKEKRKSEETDEIYNVVELEKAFSTSIEVLLRTFIIYFKKYLTSSRIDSRFRSRFMDIFVIAERYEERVTFYDMVLRYYYEKERV